MSDAEDGAPDETIFVADSVDEFVERTQHQQLLNAKETSAETLRNSVQIRMQSRGDGQTAAREAVRRAVEQYVLEAESLYNRTEAGQLLWEKAHVDTVPMSKALSLGSDAEQIASIQDIKSRGAVQPYQQNGRWLVDLQGVGSYFDFEDTPFQITYQVKLNRRGGATKENTVTLYPETPVNTSREVFRATNALLAELDLGVRMGETTDTVESEYTSLFDRLTDE
jgi:hypothetical protein